MNQATFESKTCQDKKNKKLAMEKILPSGNKADITVGETL